jgi:hypothetical protein
MDGCECKSKKNNTGLLAILSETAFMMGCLLVGGLPHCSSDGLRVCLSASMRSVLQVLGLVVRLQSHEFDFDLITVLTLNKQDGDIYQRSGIHRWYVHANLFLSKEVAA